MRPILVNIFTPQELNHSSYVQTGLFELEKEAFLTTKVKLSFSKRLGTLRVLNGTVIETSQPHPKTSFYELVDLETNKKILFATDLYDAADSFSKYALEHCDYVFKRNLDNDILQKLPKKYQSKVHALGLSFKVNPGRKKGRWKFYIGVLVTNIGINLKIDRLFFRRFKKTIMSQVQHYKNAYKSNTLSLYENISAESSENSILFQTRCFPIENQKDVQEIHQQRYRIILKLRKSFGNQFKGGFIPSDLAKLKYNDALTNLPTDPESYLALVKKSKIVIYTRGLLRSPAWKMAEYLSQGKIIIAEKLTAEQPVALQHGKEVLFFEDEKEIVPLIEKVLNDPNLSEMLSHNAKKYFDNYVHPKKNMKRIITFMLDQNK